MSLPITTELEVRTSNNNLKVIDQFIDDMKEIISFAIIEGNNITIETSYYNPFRDIVPLSSKHPNVNINYEQIWYTAGEIYIYKGSITNGFDSNLDEFKLNINHN